MKSCAKEKRDKFKPSDVGFAIARRLRCQAKIQRKERKKQRKIYYNARASKKPTNTNKVQNNKWKIVQTYLRCLIENRNYYRTRRACVRACVCVHISCMCNACINKCTSHFFRFASIAFFTSNKYFIIPFVCVCECDIRGRYCKCRRFDKSPLPDFHTQV